MKTARWQGWLTAARKPKRLLQGFLILLLLVGLFGYLVLPNLIRSKAETWLTQTLHRPVSIGKVSVSPYWLSVTLHQFKVAEPDGKQTFLSLDALRVRLSPMSLLRMTPVIGNITLSKPYVHLRRNSAGQLNIQDLLAPQPDSPEKPASPPAERHTIGSINIENGNFIFEDAAQGKAFRAAVEDFNLDIDTLRVDLKQRKIAFDEIASNHALYHFTHLKALQDFSAPRLPSATPLPPPSPAAKPYAIQIERVQIENWGAKLDDQRQAAATETVISGIALNAEKITTELGKSNRLDVNARINGTGTLQVNGEFSISPLAADLNLALKDANIAGLRPFLADNLNLVVTSANLSAQGTLKIKDETKKGLSGSFRADASLDNVQCKDTLHQRPVLGWKSLAVKDLQVAFMPLAVSIDSVLLDEYFAHLNIDEAGRLNVKDILRPGPAKTPAQAKPQQSRGEALPFTINTVRLQQGKIRFTDQYIQPNYQAELTRLNARIVGLSSEKKSKATLDLEGRINRSPLTLKGSFNPFDDTLVLNLRGDLRALELLPLTPYASQYAGYAIEDGTLSINARYQIARHQLRADNRLILDQFKLSAEPTQPDKALPLPLAAAMLRDTRGVIDIRLPISGSMDDPAFSIGGLVVQALFNTIMKAVISPFSLLGSAFGEGGEELGWLAFAPGQAGLDEKNRKKLGMLSEALLNRPAMKLEIIGMADPQVDDAGLRKLDIQRRVRLQKQESLDEEKASAKTNIVVTPDEYPALLKAVYQDEVGFSLKRLLGEEKEKTVEEMEQFLMAKVKLEKQAVPALATQRAAATKAWLVTHGKIPAERIEMRPTELRTANQDPSKGRLATTRVEFKLKP